MPEVNLEFSAEQQERILRQLGSLRDDVGVVSATTLRLDSTIDRCARNSPSKCKACATR